MHEHIEVFKKVMTQEYSNSNRSHVSLNVTCRAARRPGYFFWNVFLIMVTMVTVVPVIVATLPPPAVSSLEGCSLRRAPRATPRDAAQRRDPSSLLCHMYSVVSRMVVVIG